MYSFYLVLFYITTLFPLLLITFIGLPLLFGERVSEKLTRFWVKSYISVSYIFLAACLYQLIKFGFDFHAIEPTDVFFEHKILAWFEFTPVNIIFFFISIFISGIIGFFAIDYLQGERFFYKFFINYFIFVSGLHLISLADEFIVFFLGWEMIGLTSIFLISFYQERRSPILNSLATFAVYKISDFCMLAAILVMTKMYGLMRFSELVNADLSLLMPIGFLLIIAASVKAAQYPFSRWLPRAMEGPTPSSAAFYGALSVHAGVLLLLKMDKIIEANFSVQCFLFLIGILSVVHATFVGRTQADAKASLAYATIAQIGLMFIEVSLGFIDLCLFHMVSHMIIRTYQYLRTPSMIQIFNDAEAIYGSHFYKTGLHYEKILPRFVRRLLYYFSLEEGGIDAITKIISNKIRAVSRFCGAIQNKFFKLIKVDFKKSELSMAFILLVSIFGFFIHSFFKEYDVLIDYISLAVAFFFTLSTFEEVYFSRFLNSIGVSYLSICLLGVNLFSPTYFFINIGFIFLNLCVIFYFLLDIQKSLGLKKVRHFLGVYESAPVRAIFLLLFILLFVGIPTSPEYTFFEHLIEKSLKYHFPIGFLTLFMFQLNSYVLFKFVFKIIYGPTQLYVDYHDLSMNKRSFFTVFFIAGILLNILFYWFHIDS